MSNQPKKWTTHGPYPYAPIRRPMTPNPAAHGNIVLVDIADGWRRERAVNGQHVEIGEWMREAQ